jgi:hypothetical protein
MTLFDKKTAKMLSGIIGKDYIEKEVTKKWQESSKCLEKLSNKNKDELNKINLQLLEGLTYEGQDAEKLFKELKASQNITPEQTKFAKFLYINYPKHSIKAQGFD